MTEHCKIEFDYKGYHLIAYIDPFLASSQKYLDERLSATLLNLMDTEYKLQRENLILQRALHHICHTKGITLAEYDEAMKLAEKV